MEKGRYVLCIFMCNDKCISVHLTNELISSSIESSMYCIFDSSTGTMHGRVDPKVVARSNHTGIA